MLEGLWPCLSFDMLQQRADPVTSQETFYMATKAFQWMHSNAWHEKSDTFCWMFNNGSATLAQYTITWQFAWSNQLAHKEIYINERSSTYVTKDFGLASILNTHPNTAIAISISLKEHWRTHNSKRLSNPKKYKSYKPCWNFHAKSTFCLLDTVQKITHGQWHIIKNAIYPIRKERHSIVLSIHLPNKSYSMELIP